MQVEGRLSHLKDLILRLLISSLWAHTTWGLWAAVPGCALGLTLGCALQLAVNTRPDLRWPGHRWGSSIISQG